LWLRRPAPKKSTHGHTHTRARTPTHLNPFKLAHTCASSHMGAHALTGVRKPGGDTELELEVSSQPVALPVCAISCVCRSHSLNSQAALCILRTQRSGQALPCRLPGPDMHSCPVRRCPLQAARSGHGLGSCQALLCRLPSPDRRCSAGCWSLALCKYLS